MPLAERSLTSFTVVTTTGTTASVTPTGMQDGDWILIGVEAAGGTGAHSNTAGGLTRVHDDINGGNTVICSTWKKKCDAGESGTTYTFSTGSGSNRRWAVYVMCYSGGDPTDIIESAPVGTTVSGTSIDATGVDPVDTGAVHLIWAFQRTAAGVNATFTPPTNYTKGTELYTNSGGATNSNLAPMTRALPNANATGDQTWTSDTNDRLATASMLLKAASGASTVNLTPATMTFAGVAVDPDPQPVSVGLTAAVMTLTAIATDPDPGPVTVALTPASVVLAAVSVVATPVVNLTPATITLAAVAVDPDPGQVTVNLTSAVLTLDAIAVVATPIVNLTPASMTLAAVAVNPVPGPVTVNLTAAVMTFTAPALGAGGITVVELTPATFSLGGVVVDPVPGAVTVALTPAVIAFGAPAVVAIPGVVTVSLTAASLMLTAVVVSPQPQPVTVVLSVATVTFTAVPVSFNLQSSVNLIPAVLTLSAVALLRPRDPDAIVSLAVPVVMVTITDKSGTAVLDPAMATADLS